MIRIQNGDSIKISSFSSKAGVVLKIYGQILLPGGKIIPFEDGLTTTATRLEVSKNITVTNGYLISISVGVSSGSLMHAQCFIKAEHQLGVQAPYTSLKTLFSDYITTDTNCTFPGSPLAKSFSGHGYAQYENIANPGVGVDVILTPPTNAIYKIRAAQATLTSSASNHGGNNREVFLMDRRGGSWGQSYQSGFTQLPSTVVEYKFTTEYYEKYSATYGNLTKWANLGNIVVDETQNVRLALNADWGDDTFTAGTFMYFEWINI